MKYVCDLNAEHCDLAWVVVNTSGGDELELRASESQRFLARNLAESVQKHFATRGKQVTVTLRIAAYCGDFSRLESVHDENRVAETRPAWPP